MPFLEGVCVSAGTDGTTGTGKGNHSCVREIYLFIILKIVIVAIIDHLLCVTHVLGTILNKEQGHVPGWCSRNSQLGTVGTWYGKITILVARSLAVRRKQSSIIVSSEESYKLFICDPGAN